MIECPKPALDKLKKAGLVDRLARDRDKWFSAATSLYFDRGDFYDVFDKAIKYLENTSTNTHRPFFKRITDLIDETRKDSCLRPEDTLMNYPEVMAYIILGDDVFRFADYGYETQKQLEESVTSFCLGYSVVPRFNDSSYYWVYGDYKNLLSNSYHGDCHIFQTDISGRYFHEKTLFGEREVFDTWKNTDECRKMISAHYDNWESWLAILLKYAKEIGRENIPEITNWRDVLREVGESHVNATEAEFGDFSDFFGLELPVMVEGRKLEAFPITINGDDQKDYIPFVKDKRLLIIVNDKDGNMEFPEYPDSYFSNKKFKQVLAYEESDLTDLLKGTYKLFARDRSRMPKIIESFSKGELVIKK